MSKKIILLFMVSSFLLSMCRAYSAEPSQYTNGLSCRNYTNFPQQNEQGASCSYVCPDGSTKETTISGSISPLYAASKAELDARFCGIALPPTATQTDLPTDTATATVLPSVTSSPTASPTIEATATLAVSPAADGLTGTPLPATVPASATPETAGTLSSSVLTGRVTMCDTAANLISFRLVQPPPDLTGQTVIAQIAGQENACYVNQVNPSLLTCGLPAGVIFPVQVIVSVDGDPVSDFTFNGLGCGKLSTPMPTTTP